MGLDNPCRIHFLSLRMNKCLERVNHGHFWTPVVFIYAMIPRCCPNSRKFFFIVTSVVYVSSILASIVYERSIVLTEILYVCYPRAARWDSDGSFDVCVDPLHCVDWAFGYAEFLPRRRVHSSCKRLCEYQFESVFGFFVLLAMNRTFLTLMNDDWRSDVLTTSQEIDGPTVTHGVALILECLLQCSLVRNLLDLPCLPRDSRLNLPWAKALKRACFFSSCVSISNPNLLSSSGTGVDPGIRSWKMHLSDWAQCPKAIGGIFFTKKWRAETPQPGLEFDNFKPRLKSCIFKCISWLNCSFFGSL